MKAVESLTREHQVISRLAEALAAYARRLEQGRPVKAADLGQFARVFIDFAECIHHEKEEHILLPALARHGSRWETGVLPAVRRDHRQESYLIDVLRQAGERATAWNDEDRRHVVAAALALVEFQRNHHVLESTELFPLVPLRLSGEELQALQAALEKFDRAHDQRRTSALELAERLISRYASAPNRPFSPATALVAADLEEPSEWCLGLDD